MELSDKIYNKLTKLSKKGDEFAVKQKFDKAVKTYEKAMALLTEPKCRWEATEWLYVAIGDAYFLCGNFVMSLSYFMEAYKCAENLGNPFLCLRLGQCHYELEHFDDAKDYLLSAYMLEGDEIFHEDDGKYFEFIREFTGD